MGLLQRLKHDLKAGMATLRLGTAQVANRALEETELLRIRLEIRKLDQKLAELHRDVGERAVNLREGGEPGQHEERARGMGKDPRRPKASRGEDCVDEPTGVGHQGHVTADAIRSPVARPVESHGPVAGANDLAGSPIVTGTVIAEPVKNQDGAPVHGTRFPFPHQNPAVNGAGIVVESARARENHPIGSPRPENIPVADGSPIAYFRRPSLEGEFARLAQG